MSGRALQPYWCFVAVAEYTSPSAVERCCCELLLPSWWILKWVHPARVYRQWTRGSVTREPLGCGPYQVPASVALSKGGRQESMPQQRVETSGGQLQPFRPITAVFPIGLRGVCLERASTTLAPKPNLNIHPNMCLCTTLYNSRYYHNSNADLQRQLITV